MQRSSFPRENLFGLTSGRSAGWIPFTFDVGAIQGFTDPVLERFRRETGAESPDEHFDYDFRCFSLPVRFGGADPRLFHREAEPDTTFDEWGVGHWAGGARGTYEKMYHPLASAESVREVEALPSPLIQEPADPAKAAVYRNRGYPIFGYAGSVYEWSWWLRGMQAFLMDLILNPLIAEAIVRKVAAHTRALALASAGAGIDVLCFYDDAGTQRGLQLSPELWRRFIKPRWREILSELRSTYPDCRFFLHSCGNIEAILADIVELGFHILHPIQPECMDLERVKRDFGARILLSASLSAQRLLPFGSAEEIRREVRRLRRLFAGDGRCILCPANRLQPETPWANILAFAEEARRL